MRHLHAVGNPGMLPSVPLLLSRFPCPASDPTPMDTLLRFLLPASRRMRLAATATGACALAVVQAAGAQSLADTVVISASRIEQRQFDAPAAIDAVEVDPARAVTPLVNLSELVAGVPGLAARERQNYAQDLQLAVRGFGARSTFGVRGVRLLVDGIPATMPDGQGQAATALLSAARRVEVLRGPVAQLYGNASGGLVQVFSQDPPLADGATAAQASWTLGSDRQQVGTMRVARGFGAAGLSLDLLHMETGGWRHHGAARRTQAQAKWVWQATPATRATGLLQSFEQPLAQDPLGLARAQAEAAPRSAVAAATAFDTRKSIGQHQAGLLLDHRLGNGDSLRARAYAGERTVWQALAFSGAAPASAGGIVDLANHYRGGALSWSHGRPGASAARWTVGIESDRLVQARRGHVNVNGQQGALRRDETDTASNLDLFGQLHLRLAPSWEASAGLRRSTVRLAVDDHFVTAASPDDSGGVRYVSTNPVLGLTWMATPDLNVYANAGRGTETPTLTEIAYRAGGSGPNLGLRPARSTQRELGIKWRATRSDVAQRIDAALFDTDTRDDIVPARSEGGRALFGNAGRVTRRGVEAAWELRRGDDHVRLAWTWLDARFATGFVTVGGATIPPGNRLPGAARQAMSAEAGRRVGAWKLSAQWRAEGRVAADDANSDFAPGHGMLGLQAAREWQMGAARAHAWVRIDNLLDRRAIGSVIVNEGNRRFFEPAPGRRMFAGVRLAY